MCSTPRRKLVDIALTVDGRTLTLGEWSECHGVPVDVIRARIKAGWAPERAVFESRNHAPKLTANGVTHTLLDWAKISGIPLATLQSRVRQKTAAWPAERVVTEPYRATNKPQGPRYAAEPGSPNSISWDIEPWETDAAAQRFVLEHPDGAEFHVICEAIGLQDSQARAASASGLAKLRRLALTGDRDALEFLGNATGDVEPEELVDRLAERFPRSDPHRSDDGPGPTDVLDACEIVSLHELEAANEPDDFAELGYATAAW